MRSSNHIQIPPPVRAHRRGAAIALALAGLLSLSCTPERPPQRVVLISVDTLRPDFLTCYSPDLDTSPNVERFAAESVVFTDVRSHAPSTTISHKSLLYSVYPAVHKTTRYRIPEEKLPSPVEALRDAGLRTAAFVGGGAMAPEIGFPKGFESYEVLPRLATGLQLETLRTESLRWLQEHRQEGFFLFLHMYQPHCPYWPPAEYRSRYAGWYKGDMRPFAKCGEHYNRRTMSDVDYRYIRDLYAGEVAYVDDYLGDLFAELKRLEIWDDTIVVLTSDHGESLGERDYVGHNLLFDVQLHVPLVMRLPEALSARIDTPVESIDVMATIFEALALPLPYPFQGRSLLPLTRGESLPERPRFANQGDRISVYRGPWHLVFGGAEAGTVLYDFRNDPEELTNLAGRHPDVVAEMRAAYDESLVASDSLSAAFVLEGTPHLNLEAETLARLRALGYVD